MTAKITSKGQITIPVEVRKRLNLQTGDRIAFVFDGEGKVVLHPKKLPFEMLRGMLRRPGQKRLSVRQMDAARDQALLERWERVMGPRNR